MADSARATLDQLAKLGLLAEADVAAYKPRIRQELTTAQTLLEELVRAKKLTKFQASIAMRGKAQGLVLGNYVLLDKLGAGGMGQVYRAQHRLMGRLVAVKVLSRERTESARSVQRFQREIQAAARLAHPNIVAAYDADSHGGLHYLVLELVEGQDLHHLVRRGGAIAPATAIDYVIQAARGLEYAHSQGIVHRDVKPANLLLSAGGIVKVMDLGLARYQQEAAVEQAAGLTEPGALMGTVDFMPPEQALSPQDADARSDQYSLGATLYFLLAGEPMFSGDSLMSRLVAHRTQRIPSLAKARDDLPPALVTAFEKMVAKRPADRYPSLAPAITALEVALAACAPATNRSPHAPREEPSLALRAGANGPASESDSGPCEPPPIVVTRPATKQSPPKTLLFGSGTTFAELFSRGLDREPSRRAMRWFGSHSAVAAAGMGIAALLALAVGLPWLLGGFGSDRETVQTTPLELPPVPDVGAPPDTEPSPIEPSPGLPILPLPLPPVDLPGPIAPASDPFKNVPGEDFPPQPGAPVIPATASPGATAWLGAPRVLAGLASDVRAVGFSPNGQIVAAAGDDQKVGLWHASDGAPIQLLDFSHGAASALAFNRDNSVLAVGGASGAVFYKPSTWEPTDLTAWQTLRDNGQARGVLSIIPCSAACFRMAGGIDRFYHFNADGTLSGNYGVAPPNVAGSAIAARADQLRVAGGSRNDIVVFQSEVLADGKRNLTKTQMLGGHTAAVACLAYSPSQEFLASGAKDQTVRLWKADDGEALATCELDGHVVSIAFSADSRVLLAASASGTIVVLAVPSLEIAQTHKLPEGELIHALALASDGTTVATAGDQGRVKLWAFDAAQALPPATQ